MNIRRGLWRAWAILSLLWVALVAWSVDIPCLMGMNPTGTKDWCEAALVNPGPIWAEALTVMASGPLISAAAGLAIAWVVAGFRRD